VPLHVADPPLGDAQAAHDVAPQELVDELLEHALPHRCVLDGQAHAEPWQVMPPVQAFPHPPQLFASLVVSTQLVPQAVGVAAEQFAEHARPLPEALHRRMPVHATVQLPQCAPVVTSVSQPLVGLLSQSAQPAMQLPGANEHLPALHVELMTCGSAEQSLPQLPQ
jgi:hypothetical protein